VTEIQADTAQQLLDAALCKEQCVKEAEQEIAALQDQILALNAQLELEKASSQIASAQNAAISAEMTNSEKAICNFMTELRAESQKILKFHAEIDEFTELVNCNLKYSRDLPSTASIDSDNGKSEKTYVTDEIKSEAEELKLSSYVDTAAGAAEPSEKIVYPADIWKELPAFCTMWDVRAPVSIA
jgi:uncharacterized small protein (DUF1192 family)